MTCEYHIDLLMQLCVCAALGSKRCTGLHHLLPRLLQNVEEWHSLIAAVEPQPLPGAVHAEAKLSDTPACGSVVMVVGEMVDQAVAVAKFARTLHNQLLLEVPQR
jgi:hypothetical protein